MSLGNPTQIRLGMTGEFFNRTYRVIGRAVLGVIEDGRAYYWNEFYLESAGGEPVTLVFEDTAGSCAWRLFTMLDPPVPLTAAGAAAKRQGDTVDIDGTTFRVTLVDQSKVYRVEGRAPEGVEPGKVAHYFNAEAGSREIVVSWTGEEVEYYSGMNTSAPLVASAFRLQGLAAWRFTSIGGRSWMGAKVWLPALVILALLGIPAACFVDLSHSRRAPSVTVVNAPASPLRDGASGVLEDTPYKITGHELADMAEMGRRWQRLEYDLSGPDNQEAWLACEAGPSGPVWFLCTPLQPANPLTPLAAGGMVPGQKVEVNGNAVPVRELFRRTVLSSAGGSVFYGFTGPISSNRVLLVCWNQTNIIYRQGVPVPAKKGPGGLRPIGGKALTVSCHAEARGSSLANGTRSATGFTLRRVDYDYVHKSFFIYPRQIRIWQTDYKNLEPMGFAEHALGLGDAAVIAPTPETQFRR